MKGKLSPVREAEARRYIGEARAVEFDTVNVLPAGTVYHDHPFPAPGFLFDRICVKDCPFTTADIRKMWPHLQRLLQVDQNRKRPMGDAEVGTFMLELMSKPGAGGVLTKLSVDMRLGKHYGGLFFDAKNGRFKFDWEKPVENQAGRADQLATMLFQALWIYGEIPPRDECERLLIMAPESSRVREVLDYIKSVTITLADKQPAAEAAQTVGEGPAQTAAMTPNDYSGMVEEAFRELHAVTCWSNFGPCDA